MKFSPRSPSFSSLKPDRLRHRSGLIRSPLPALGGRSNSAQCLWFYFFHQEPVCAQEQVRMDLVPAVLLAVAILAIRRMTIAVTVSPEEAVPDK